MPEGIKPPAPKKPEKAPEQAWRDLVEKIKNFYPPEERPDFNTKEDFKNLARNLIEWLVKNGKDKAKEKEWQERWGKILDIRDALEELGGPFGTVPQNPPLGEFAQSEWQLLQSFTRGLDIGYAAAAEKKPASAKQAVQKSEAAAPLTDPKTALQSLKSEMEMFWSFNVLYENKPEEISLSENAWNAVLAMDVKHHNQSKIAIPVERLRGFKNTLSGIMESLPDKKSPAYRDAQRAWEILHTALQALDVVEVWDHQKRAESNEAERAQKLKDFLQKTEAWREKHEIFRRPIALEDCAQIIITTTLEHAETNPAIIKEARELSMFLGQVMNITPIDQPLYAEIYTQLYQLDAFFAGIRAQEKIIQPLPKLPLPPLKPQPPEDPLDRIRGEYKDA